MLSVDFHSTDSIPDHYLKFAVVCTRYKNRWVFVKHKDKMTWEIPGGKREAGESIERTAERELYEETGAEKYNIIPICVYSVLQGETKTFGKLYYAEIESFVKLPDSEIETVDLFDQIPEQLTYPLIQPLLYKKANELLNY